jgi:threonine aldolase
MGLYFSAQEESMFSFQNDYSEGAHPRIFAALAAANLEQTQGYGNDPYTGEAARLIRARLKNNDAQVHFLAGGTQTNLVALTAFLRPHEAVVSAVSGHINVHETGAVEAAGHKVIAVPSSDGKLTPERVLPVLRAHSDEHMVKPRVVYISNSTEVGTCYSKAELTALREFCLSFGLLLYMDGARLGSALACSDAALSDIAALTDAFYIGGTKNGALLGEALVITNLPLASDIRYIIKQRGGMLAKGRVLGLQFCELFRDGLYFEIAAHANRMADVLRDGIRRANFAFLSGSVSNQLFPIFPDELAQALSARFRFDTWGKPDEAHTCVRLVTSWATRQEAVDAFLQALDVRA